MKIAGIDEAGRGSLIGPLVISCALVEKRHLQKLKEAGVKDSKKLSKEARLKIRKKISFCKFFTILFFPPEIDKISLNELEARGFAQLLESARAHLTYIDLPEPLERFKNRMKKLTAKRFEAYHKADEKNVVVAAASINAKLVRDRYIEKIKSKVGFDFGSGYPSDPKTISAVRERYRELKPYIRKKWKIRPTRSLLEFL